MDDIRLTWSRMPLSLPSIIATTHTHNRIWVTVYGYICCMTGGREFIFESIPYVSHLSTLYLKCVHHSRCAVSLLSSQSDWLNSLQSAILVPRQLFLEVMVNSFCTAACNLRNCHRGVFCQKYMFRQENVDIKGFEPLTFSMQSRRSTTDLNALMMTMQRGRYKGSATGVFCGPWITRFSTDGHSCYRNCFAWNLISHFKLRL